MAEQATVDQSITVQVNAPLSVILHPAEGGGYWAEVPAFAGMMYAEGGTAEETVKNVETMLTVYFQGRERGETWIVKALPPKLEALRRTNAEQAIAPIIGGGGDETTPVSDEPPVFTENFLAGLSRGVEPIAEEIAFYKAHLAEWAEHEGEYVLIKGDAAHGFFGTRDAAVREGYQRFGRVPFLAQQVLLDEKPRPLSWAIR